MTRQQLLAYINDRYSVQEEYPWNDENCICRHRSSRKWFAVVMRVAYGKLGLPREGTADGVNFKCDPLLTGSYRLQPGVLPGYHMNKEHWLTVLLDGTAEDDLIKELLEISFDLTNNRRAAPESSEVK